MKVVIFLAFVGIGVILAFSSSGSEGAQQPQPGWQQGMNSVDSYLQGVLTPELNSKLTEKTNASADWLGGWKQKVTNAAD